MPDIEEQLKDRMEALLIKELKIFQTKSSTFIFNDFLSVWQHIIVNDHKNVQVGAGSVINRVFWIRIRNSGLRIQGSGCERNNYGSTTLTLRSIPITPFYWNKDWWGPRANTWPMALSGCPFLLLMSSCAQNTSTRSPTLSSAWMLQHLCMTLYILCKSVCISGL